MTHGTVKVDGCALAYVREGYGPSMMIIGSASYYQKTFSHRHTNPVTRPIRAHYGREAEIFRGGNCNPAGKAGEPLARRLGWRAMATHRPHGRMT